MANNPTWLAVVGLALFDAHGRVLMAQRPARKHHGGLWEFPGGKVEAGEKPRFSLIREIEEELGIGLDAGQLRPAGFAEEAGEKHIVLFLYTARHFTGEPEAREGQAWGWFTLTEAAALDLAPMDRALLQALSG